MKDMTVGFGAASMTDRGHAEGGCSPVDDLKADLARVARIAVVPTILEVVCRSLGVGFAAVARVTDQRWIACAVRDEIAFGLQPGSELELHATFCNEIRQTGQAVLFDDAEIDADYRCHPLPARYGIRSYVSVPILRPDGTFFGTLCAIDRKATELRRSGAESMLRLYGQLIGFHLDAQDRLEESEAALAAERRQAELREQFIAVLGHDLRNPLAAIDAGTRLLAKEPLTEQGRSVLALTERSVGRMVALIGNVLDFARGRLGGGLPIQKAPVPLAPVLDQVLAELRVAWPGRRIVAEIDLPAPVGCDPRRLGQLLSNLLANALTHGAADGTVAVRAAIEDGLLVVAVVNEGPPIPPGTRERLFQPFTRGPGGQGQAGLGLGLYIAAEIARAHAGRIEVASGPAETCFTFVMPVAGMSTDALPPA